jgi:prenyltransferase beta subunit
MKDIDAPPNPESAMSFHARDLRGLLCVWIGAASLSVFSPQASPAVIERQVDAQATVAWLLGCQKPNGAFGPYGHAHSDLAWNYPAVHALVLLGEPIPRPKDCLVHGVWAAFREPDAHPTNLHWDLDQKVQLNLLLHKAAGLPIGVFPGQRDNGQPIKLGSRWTLKFEDRKGAYYGPYGLGVFYDISTLWYTISALKGLDGTIANPELAKEFIIARQSANGGFVDAYRTETPPEPAAAHVVITYHAVMAFQALGLDVPQRAACVEFLQACQTPEGGFRWSPTHRAHSNQADVWYAWAAVRALDALGAQPRDREKCVAWINGLQNPDGGFGDRPGWDSRIYSTYYAVHALAILRGDAKKGITAKRVSRTVEEIPDGKFTIFQAHLKSSPDLAGSQAAMVDEVQKMKLHLVGAKAEDVAAARARVQEKGYRLEVLANPENYAHKLCWLGGDPANHVSNWLIPPGMTPDARRQWAQAAVAGKQGLPWEAFKEQVIAPALRLGTLFYPELDFSMTNAYMVYDDGLDGQPGYNAFLAALGWPAWDWVRQTPYRERWVGKLPALADGDAHGDLAKWRSRPEKQRVLYLAPSHELTHFLDACRNRRTVCVIRDPREPAGVVLYGTPAAVGYVQRHRAQWQWWTDDGGGP